MWEGLFRVGAGGQRTPLSDRLPYNVGSRAFCQSTLVRKLNAEDYAGACAELLRWRFFQGKDCTLPANARLCGGLAVSAPRTPSFPEPATP